MNRVKFEKGILNINGEKFLQVYNDGRFIRKALLNSMPADQNVYDIKYFKGLPEELKIVLKNTCWVRIVTSDVTKTTKQTEQIIRPATPVTVGK